MAITKEEIEYIANLAKIQLSDEEAERFAGEMEEMIRFANQLSGLETHGIPPIDQKMEQENVFREDIAGASYPTDLLLENAPEQEEGCYLVPKTVKGPGGGHS